MISLEVDAASADSYLREVVARSRDRTTPNRQLSVQLQGWVFRNFQQEGGLQPEAWDPLAEVTRVQKEREGYSRSPLVRTGHLRQSFRGFYDNDRAGVGSEVPYSQYHQDGTDTIPARPMLPPRAVVLDYARQVYERWGAGVVK